MRSDVVSLTCALSVQAGLALLLIGCASHSVSRVEKRANESDARAASLHWLQLLDDGDYEGAIEFIRSPSSWPRFSALSSFTHSLSSIFSQAKPNSFLRGQSRLR